MTQAEHHRWQQTNKGLQLQTCPVPKLPVRGVLLKNRFALVGPNHLHSSTQEAGQNNSATHNPAGLRCWSVAQVVQSNHQGFADGQWVMTRGELAEYFVATHNMWSVDYQNSPVKNYLSVLGEAGLSAYFSLLRVGLLQAGQKVMIANAGSLTGLFAIQICQLKGCEVIALSRSKARAQMLYKRFGVFCLCPSDEDYKRTLADQHQRMQLILDLPGNHCSTLLPCLADQGQWLGCFKTALKPNTDSEFNLPDWQAEFAEAQTILQRWLQQGVLRWQVGAESAFSDVAELVAQQKTDPCMGAVVVNFN